jgi:hypothetical protein
MIEGSRAGAGSVPRTYGSGSVTLSISSPNCNVDGTDFQILPVLSRDPWDFYPDEPEWRDAENINTIVYQSINKQMHGKTNVNCLIQRDIETLPSLLYCVCLTNKLENDYLYFLC